MSRSDATVDLAYLDALENESKRLKPYGWGIVDKDGDAVIGTCIEIHRDITAMKELVTIWNEQDSGAYRFVQLFYKDEE